jgi:hypothetical protein
VVLLLAAGFSVQARFFQRFPQPPLFGDALGYFWTGQQVRAAFASAAGGHPVSALERVRPFGHFAVVGLLFSFMPDGGGDSVARFRLLLATIAVFGMLGCFLLARALGGRVLGGAVALVMAAVHPSFSMLAGRLYPEPAAAAGLVWASWLYVRGVQRGHRPSLTAAGAVLVASLLFRPKLIPYVLVLVALVSVAVFAFRPRARPIVMAVALGWVPIGGLWVAAAVFAQGRLDATLPEYNLAWKQPYPLGFWQFLDTDGFEGPYRLKTDPYYKAMEAAAASDAGLLRSRPRQYVFTLRYLAGRPREATLTFLESMRRLYDRPENPYRWDYPFDYRWQLWLQRTIAVLALASFATLVPTAPALAPVWLVPAALLLLHGLAFALPRYGTPPLLVLIAAAGAYVGWCVPRLRGPAARATALVAVAAVLTLAAGEILLMRHPEASRWLRLAGTAVFAGVPFLLGALLADGRRPWLPAASWGFLVVLLAAHTLRDPSWHEVELTLGHGRGVDQEITLSAAAVAELRSASEAFVVFDLSVPRGDTRGVSVEIGGLRRPGAELRPTMPRLPEDTTVGGRDWRGYPQWWALSLTPEMLPVGDAPVRVRLRAEGDSQVVLRGDRFPAQDTVYEGPSFGDWPQLVAVKLQYDGDYRIPIRQPLGSERTESLVVDGERAQPWRGRHRIRLVTLAANEGWLSWESAAPAADARAAAFAFTALAAGNRSAELSVDGVTVASFPLGGGSAFDQTSGGVRLCFRGTGDPDHPLGQYALSGVPVRAGRPVRFDVRFRTGMRDENASFVLPRGQEAVLDRAALGACAPPPGVELIPGVGRILDASHNNYPADTGRWRVAGVF